MPDRGIIFTAENAAAIWQRRKTQTRRLALKEGRRSVWADTQPGDWLWVREPWRPCVPSADPAAGALYQASRPRDAATFRLGRHMPKWASRMTLVVQEARIERLHDITDEDALAENADLPPGSTFRDGFRLLWESIHGAGAWAANPEVVQIAFRMEPVNIHTMGSPPHHQQAWATQWTS